MSPAESSELVAVLVAAFPRTIVSVETLSIYARFLEDLDFKIATEAVAAWILREKYWPTISELRTATEQKSGNAAPDLDRAWAEVRRSFSYSDERRPEWSHPAIRDAVEAIGHREIGQSTQPDVTRAHFQRAYEAAAKRNADPAHRLIATTIAGDVQKRVGTGARKAIGK
jgi:hypothetical protein